MRLPLKRIYLDNNATTPLDPRVKAAMLRDLTDLPQNPSSVHWFGRQAKALLVEARTTVANFFNASLEEIVFTSGATESLNFLLRGMGSSGHILSTSIEHAAVLNTLESLEKSGQKITYLPVDAWGAPRPEAILHEIRPDTKAIVLSLANAETGVKIDLKAIHQIAYERRIPLLIDAVALIGKEPFQLLPAIQAVAISAHKFHGPKGVGALYVRKGLKLSPLHTGGPQERMLRAGTENLAGILGLSEALNILQTSQENITDKLQKLQERLETGLLALPNSVINGDGPRVPNTSNIAFLGVDGETLLMYADLAGIAISHGSACNSGALEPSRVLKNMGLDPQRARSSVRFSLSRMNTFEEIDVAVATLSAIVRKLCKMSNRHLA
ncbi:MAG: hypothetical protein A3D96_07525 [Chlamydiae bacterium RIFCSPHIGHO2_12_FULL_44_59]|nr:MAG: hypothetical protein A2796_06835 [Chlamydiae bacterium RIFCSPHIGHO2_01_FULL_44_39]OGN56985.1 MAG: hypothetical protein A3C42_03755 [Chlamydiae bacterium RIFCSPHIGHO2_02_FULL_45_9]OGN59537.1 MAG: hypothetical protein A3D96_07525 [Chlamydiae bacterium RIFCSPHIGHO2_12_FULL_44_59]OGN67282.1 MAG: hypothetical protein A2978_03355 [Chlamydiae bacterium RIFCSPLOWO2_01_FULL_44_52]OGN68704.1 MAG: hypothetical protein A3I67_03085 [Chlamydiae bacterium RIFCSPLOWO2_02_FULL_45_22]OGN69225.1 MAG: hyp